MGSHRKFVLAYSTTMHIKYMHKVCPKARLVGVGRIEGWKWVINSKRYANIVEAAADWGFSDGSSGEDVVYGLVFSLTHHDFHRLASSEQHRSGREKHKMSIRLKRRHHKSWKKAGVYVWYDPEHESGGHKTTKSYGHRMAKALKSAQHHGVPKSYVKRIVKRIKKGGKKSKASASEFTGLNGLDSLSDSEFWGGKRHRHRDRSETSGWDDDDKSSWLAPSRSRSRRHKKPFSDESSMFSSSMW